MIFKEDTRTTGIVLTVVAVGSLVATTVVGLVVAAFLPVAWYAVPLAAAGYLLGRISR